MASSAIKFSFVRSDDYPSPELWAESPFLPVRFLNHPAGPTIRFHEKNDQG
jgi:hypothetical protein